MLILIECCPALSPESFSSLLPGGILRSFRSSALLSWVSFLKAPRWRFAGTAFDRSRFHSFSVSLSAKPFIILQ